MPSKTLVTSALPYANGSLHLGHMVEFVQTDIYVRFLKSCGEDVIYLCADDTHGTPIELNAAKAGVTPDAFVARFSEEHQRDLAGFGIGLDTFGSTNSPENRHYAEMVYGRLKEAGEIDRRTIEQTYCEKDQRFLPDRFVRGTCPNCKTPDQYGDVCEHCGKTYAPTDLIEPRCVLCGTTPVRRSSEHLFFTLSKHADELLALLKRPDFLHPSVANQLQQFFEKGLSDWDISRDGPYFGFPIPGETNKFFYVWLDAPIGYIAATEKWARESGKAKSALAYWEADAETRIVHFIGKDIVYFHALFWPAVLGVARLHAPTRIHVHGHLTVDGTKMSKSRGTLIAAKTYLDTLDPSYLRFFYAGNLGSGPEDFDLSLKEFRLRVNGELVNNIGNLANRALTMLAGPLEKKLATGTDGAGRALVTAALARVPEIRDAYQKLELRNVVRAVAEISQTANQFLQAQAPWAQVKKDVEAARRDLTDAAEIAYLVAALLQPVVPKISEALFGQLGQKPLTFQQLETANYPLLDRRLPVGTPAPLIARLEESATDGLIKPSEPLTPPTSVVQAVPQSQAKPLHAQTQARTAVTEAQPAGSPAAAGEIEYDDFAKVVLKAGRILTAERVPKADKLLKLTVDVGEGEPRTIGSGIAEAYTPEALVGKRVVVVTNLKVRKIRGIESRGMLLAAGPGGAQISLVDPGDMPPGTEVK